MLVSTAGGVASRTWTGTAWSADTTIFGESYYYATLSPDGTSMFLNGGVRSKLQSNGTWSTPETVVSGGPYFWSYFNGKQLFLTGLISGAYHIMESDYNSSLDTFSTPQIITSIDGPTGTNSMFAWVSQNGTDMIFDRQSAGQVSSDLYSAHWNGSNWTNVTELVSLHADLHNDVPCVAENAGELVYYSAPSQFSSTYTIWEAPISGLTGSTSITFGLTVNNLAPDAGDTLASAAVLSTLVAGVPTIQYQEIGDGTYGNEDVDMYCFTVAQAGTVTLDVNAQRSGSSLDAYLRLFDSSGTQISANDDYYGLDPAISESLAPGTYYAGVSGAPTCSIRHSSREAEIRAAPGLTR